MRSTLGPVLVLAILLGAAAVQAQTAEGSAPSGVAASPAGAAANVGEKVKEKDKVSRLLDDVQSFAPWVPNEPSFLAALRQAQEKLASTEEAALAPLREFDPHFAHLAATLARLRVRMEPVRAAAELCDPARGDALFLLFLDTLDAEGQRAVTARICKKLASLDGAAEGLTQVCVASDLAFLAARSIRDLAVECDPALGVASADASAERIDQLRSDIAGMQAGVQDSVRAARRDLTQAMTVVAGHVSDVSSVNTTTLQETIRAGNDGSLRLEIEKALEAGKPYGMLFLPQANGGQLETVRSIVIETIRNVIASGEESNGATQKLAAGDVEFTKGRFKRAFRLYSEAYAAAVEIRPEEP